MMLILWPLSAAAISIVQDVTIPPSVAYAAEALDLNPATADQLQGPQAETIVDAFLSYERTNDLVLLQQTWCGALPGQ